MRTNTDLDDFIRTSNVFGKRADPEKCLPFRFGVPEDGNCRILSYICVCYLRKLSIGVTFSDSIFA